MTARAARAAGAVAVLVALSVLAPATPVTPVPAAWAAGPLAPLPPDPDPAALARLPDAPSAVGGLVPAGPCPAGIAPTGLDAFPTTGPGTGAPAPDAGAGVVVAVVDTGVDPHPRLAGRVRDGGDYVAGRSALADCDGHGTAVAGVVAASSAPTDLVEGVAPAATVLAVRQTSTWLRPPGRSAAGDVDTLARAVRHAAATPGVAVMTLALAACATPAELAAPDARAPVAALRAAVRDAVDRGVVVVAAAGNAGPGCGPQNAGTIATVPVPGWFDDDVLTVGAADDGVPDPSSLAGPWVDVAAPGRVAAALDARGGGLTVALTQPGSGPSPVAGTSFAAARVAGVAAELRRRDPALSAREVAARIVATATPLPGATARDPRVGAGILDAAAALRPAADPAADPASRGATGPDGRRGPTTAAVVAGIVLAGLVAGILAVVAARRRGTRRRGTP